MYRSPDDIALLTELAGVLDRTVSEAGFTSGTYLVLREVVRSDGAVTVTEIGERLGAAPEEVAHLAHRLAAEEFIQVRASGLERTPVAIARLRDLEAAANEAIRGHVLDRPHSPTVYGLVAAMQTGRFTVEDLIAFISDPDAEDEE